MTAEPNRPRKRATHHADSPATFRGKRGPSRGTRLGIEHLESRCLLSVAPAPQLVDDINKISTGSNLFEQAVVGGTLYYVPNDGFHGYELWKSNGTSSGSQLVADINPGRASSNPGDLTNVGGTLFFTANDGVHGYELWRSDGTSSGTQMLTSFPPDANGVNLLFPNNPINDLTDVNGELFFSANDGTHGYELWKSDGTSSGTQTVANINMGSDGSRPTLLTDVGGTLFFTTSNFALWKSDGTSSGTKLVGVINPEGLSADLNNLINVGGTLFFTANDGVHGNELWKTDGTSSGTVMLPGLNPSIAGSYLRGLTNLNGTLVFIYDDLSNNDLQLWAADGSTAGTRLIATLPGSETDPLTNVNGTLFFGVDDFARGQEELWKTDGTSAGTQLVSGISPTVVATSIPLDEGGGAGGSGGGSGAGGSGGSGGTGGSGGSGGTGGLSPIDFANVSGTLLFYIDNELWKSDGTSAGTKLVDGLNAGNDASSGAALLENVGGMLMFEANLGTDGYELWRSDGTSAGTQLVQGHINASTPSSNPSHLMNSGGRLFFTANDGLVSFPSLWSSDGASSGTQSLWLDGSDEVGANGTLLFTSGLAVGATSYLWMSDGTSAGTRLIADLGAQSAPYGNLLDATNVGGTLYFRTVEAGAGGSQIELWKTDGTSSGTMPIANAGYVNDGMSGEMTNVSGTLFFSDFQDLWKSDGSPAGTQMIFDPEAFGQSGPENLTNVDGTLFFTSYERIDDSLGPALFKSDGTSSGTQIVADSVGNSLDAVGGTLYFTASSSTDGYGLWKTDATGTDTQFLLPIDQGTTLGSFANLGGELYFTLAQTGSATFELWKSDGTSSGTQLVETLNGAPPASGQANVLPSLIAADGILYFAFNDGTHGDELWASDGTSSGTQMVEDLNAGSAGSNPSSLTNVNGTLFFAANNGVYGTELWEIPSRLQAPTVTNASTIENVQAASSLVILPNASEAGVATNFQITGITGGTLFLNDDVTPVTDGAFITVAQGAAGLRFKPALNWTVAGGFSAQSSSSADVTGLDGPLARAEITVTATADITSLLSPRGNVTTGQPTFQWAPVANASGYFVAIKDDTTGSDALPPTAVTSADFIPTITLVSGHEYEWGVQGFNSSGQTGLWTHSAFFDVNVPSGLGTTTPLAPLGVTTSTTPTFQWSPVNGAAGYYIAVKDDTTGGYPVAPRFVSGTSYTPNFDLLEGHNYEWGVQAVGAAGQMGNWTNSNFFNVPVFVGSPTLTGSTGAVNSTSFQWSAVTDATSYYFAVKDDTTGSYPVPPTLTTGTEFFPTLQLVSGHQYEWGVQALNAAGQKGNWSSASFSLLSLAAPILTSPSGLITSTSGPEFLWSAVTEAADYYFALRDDTHHVNILDPVLIQGASFTPAVSLAPGIDYEWNVQANGETGQTGPWGTALHFTVSTAINSAVAAASPSLVANAALAVSLPTDKRAAS